ncbi:MAG: SusE domain-containing protein [Candidatus Cryptobacteroides sp.]
MKKGIIISVLAALAAMMLPGCNEESLNISMEPVEELVSPENGISVPLQSSASASVFFEWEGVELADASMVLYEVVFDRPDGDFSNPVYRVLSDNGGTKTYVSIAHKILNKAGAAAGIGAAETGQLKWTVVSSKGIGEKICAESRTMEITRLAGFADVPESVYIIGPATEFGGAARKMAATEEGEFEIFTKLEAGKSFHFTDAASGEGRTFYPSEGSLKEGNEEGTVSGTGIYKISLDFNSGISTLAEVSSVKWFHCNSNAAVLELPYTGDGVWSLSKHTMSAEDFGDTPQLTNPRYRIHLEYADGSVSVMGPVNFSEDSMPGDNPDPSYFYVNEYTSGYEQFKPKWKRNRPNTESWIGYTYDISLVLNPDAHYTHVLSETVAEEPEPPVEETDPTELYITGTASEGGSELSSALKMTAMEENVFEIFTSLKANGNFCLASSATGTPATYSIENGEIKNGGNSTVEEDGIYKIAVNWADKKATLRKIDAVKWYHCNSGVANVVLTYSGNGIWELKNHVMTSEDVPGMNTPANDIKNPRYRFVIDYADGQTNVLGPVNISEDSAPSADSPASYYACKEYTAEDILAVYSAEQMQFNPKWKRMGGQVTWIGDNYDMTLQLNADGYTHSIKKNN